jgi:aminoglycoside phosphotransferase (APT) family kinase protein
VSRPWKAERVVAEEEARALITHVAPELRGAPLVALGAGWDNTAWRVEASGAAFVFRFPRRLVAVSCMEAELLALPLFPVLPAPITRPVFSGRMPMGDDTWPFAGYPYISGEVLATSGVADQALAHELGTFLRTLHSFDPAPLLAAGLPRDSIARLDVARRMAPVTAALSLVADTGLDTRPHLEALELGIRVGPSRDLDAVCHGDLDQRHVLVNGAGLAGIIDWGDVNIGHPAMDLALAFGLDLAARQAFFAAYGTLSAETTTLARARAIMTAARVYEWALDIRDDALKHYAIRTLRHTTAA